MKKNQTRSLPLNQLIIAGIVCGFLLIGLSLVSYLLQQELVEASHTSAAIINVSGRQRMLSEEIAWFSNRLIINDDKVAKEKIRKDILAALDLMKLSHKALIEGDSTLNLPGVPSRQVRAMYFDLPVQLDTQLRDFWRNVERLAALPDDALSLTDPLFPAVTGQALSRLLESLDAVVRQYQLEHEGVIARLKKLQTWILAFNSIIIFIMIFVIIRPVVRRLMRETDLLAKAETYNRSIVNNLSEGLIIFRDDGTIENCNPAAERILGYNSDEITGSSVSRLTAESSFGVENGEKRMAVRVFTSDIIDKGVMEYTGIRKDGTTFAMEISASSMYVDDQLKFIATFNDISECKKVKDALLGLKKAVETTALGVTISDVSGRILYTNPAEARMHGFRVEELVGKDISVLAPRDIRKQMSTKRIKELTDNRRESINVRKDGTQFPVYLTSSPVVDSAGEPISIVTVCEDITERKRAESELQRAREEADKASRAKSEFLASMSHEIRTPLTAIMGMADLLAETILDDEQLEYVSIFRRASDNLLALINDILDLSRIESGSLVLEDMDFDLVKMMEEVVELFAVRANEKGLELTSHIKPGVPNLLRGDVNRLRQILTNFIGNAIKFTDRGEVALQVDLAATNRNASSDAKGCALQFSVRDTGIGIKEEQMSIIFNNFIQGDPSYSRRYGGTGLGLAVSKKIIEKMGGDLRVDSVVGKGSTFYFTVPLQFASTGHVTTSLPIFESSRGVRILIVDDNKTNQIILKEMLLAMGFYSHLVSDGRAALEELRVASGEGSPYDLLLLDCVMPGMSGFDVTKSIEQDSSLKDLLIIILTSDMQREDIVQLKSPNVIAFLIKPVRQSDLVGAMGVVMKKMKLNGGNNGHALRHADRKDGVRDKRRILVAEDSEDIRMLIKSFLDKEGHDIDFVENGEMAIQRFTSNEYDLIFMDIQMPVRDGYDTIRELRRLEGDTGSKRVPIIALTANAYAKEKAKAKDAGFNDVIIKPFRRQALLDAISQNVDKEGNEK